MKSLRLLLFMLIFAGFNTLAYSLQTDLYFTSHPTLTPDGQTIIYSYDGDLWKIPAAGGMASRITAMDGIETRPSVSPDGKWLAFSSNKFGNWDVFVTPIDGGDIRQLTWHQSSDEMEGWSWDSNTIYFTSNRENRFSSWQVSVNGGTPTRIFGHYHNNDHNLAAHPDGRFFFNESWESKNQAHRKRYEGAFAPQIKSYNPTNGDYTAHTDHPGKDMWTTIDRNGVIYFVSDEYNGEYNLYRLNGETKERLTDFSTSIKHPEVSANGNRIVFEKDYQLWVYNVSSGTSSKVNGQVVRHSALERDQDFRVQSNISNFDVAGDKKKLAFVSRGELFISDIDGKFVQQIETASDGRVMEVKWLADNKTILFSQTWNGYQNWFTIAADGSTPETRRTSDMQNNRGIALNSDRSKAVYLSGRGDVRIMDLSAFSSETVAEEEIWDISYSSPSFSPDDRYVVFTAIRNFEQNIYVYDTQENRQITITDTGVSEANPVWSPDGKYIYFQTNRTMPSYPYGMRDAGIWRIALDRVDPEFRSDQVRALFEENDEEESDVKVTIREEGLRDRWESVGASFGSQSSPFVVQRNGKTIVLYRSNHDQGRNSWWKTVYEPFKSPVTEMINGTRMGGNTLVEVNGSLYALMSGDIYTMNPDAGSVSKIDISHTFRRNLRAEFDQMFDEMWANLEVNFYSDDFHGVEWAEIREQYRAYLPYVRSRDNLRVMMNDMLGELNTSHIGFSSGGDEESTYYGSTTLSGGILFSKDNPWTVDRLVANSTAHRSGADIRSGDRLTAVNGVQVDTDQNREMYFSRPSMDQEMVLTFSRGRDQFDVKLRPESYFATRNNLYDEWMYDRKRRVDESSGNRIAYVHMKNMGGGELQHFLQEMVAFGNSKDGLILDLRYNTGGNVHDAVLQFLSQRLYLNWSYRGGALSTQPNFTPSSNPIVLLINEPSLSDAEMLAGGFRELGLGTIIGTETYRWIIFTSGKGLVDGSSYRLPSWGVYSLTGENLEKTGVSPDIVVEKTFKDRLDGRDPQLERAVQHILQQLKN